jgi:hypothetical protein
MNNKCIGCNKFAVNEALNLGSQPVSNSYKHKIDADSIVHQLVFGICANCGLSQLIEPMPASLVKPHYSWVVYNEPEAHLDNLVDNLISEFKVSPHAKIIGTTYKDISLLNRFKSKGVINTYCLDQYVDLNIKDGLASLETIQESFTDEIVKKIVKERGRSDLIIARHILEHAHDLKSFINALRKLCTQDGLIVLEVPDCEKVFALNEHCFIWEEHITYFTNNSMKSFLSNQGFDEFYLKVYEYPMENSLVAIIKNREDLLPNLISLSPVETEIAERFSSSFLVRKKYINDLLQKIKKEGKRIGIFGAGHLAIKFINLYDVSKFLTCAIDDNPNKNGMYLPGSKLKIKSSSILDNNEIDYCLLALSPESENAVRQFKREYLNTGGTFISIFAGANENIYKGMKNVELD